MLANFLIGLREGLEAALIVGILAGYLVKTGNRKEFGKLFSGVGAAVAISILIGFGLTIAVSEAPAGINELIAGTTSIIAVVFVTWMIFWMAAQSKTLGKALRGKVDQALKTSTFTLVGVAFFADEKVLKPQCSFGARPKPPAMNLSRCSEQPSAYWWQR